ncbi:hypothetical protein M404DRAFT_995014 [Pisolithus tinctorius Marx 270]|uniref:Uncharacterized protein n=1 Tax=Pisolithus tinctorius Marx 270 TaxID=870435 RepID=A0A0C3JQB7_PISTI|nr:hypothetical protein M404DRAFT_995014 [Pisolithus tinctorius Marx 270]
MCIPTGIRSPWCFRLGIYFGDTSTASRESCPYFTILLLMLFMAVPPRGNYAAW